MIFYSIKLGAKTLDWAGTQADAKQATKDQQQKADVGAPVVTWQEEDVPTDKSSLLAWLKVNALGERKAKQ